MDLYHLWCNLKDGTSDVEFCERVDTYLGHLKSEGKIEGFRVTRRKLGFGPPTLPAFHIMVEVRDLSQLDAAFSYVARRSGVVEDFHAAVNSLVEDLTVALYRDFPDAVRERGEEKF